jgi:hypothetical protein
MIGGRASSGPLNLFVAGSRTDSHPAPIAFVQAVGETAKPGRGPGRPGLEEIAQTKPGFVENPSGIGHQSGVNARESENGSVPGPKPNACRAPIAAEGLVRFVKQLNVAVDDDTPASAA